MTELPLVRAARIPRTDTYHGVDVTEDYRWLEDASCEETIAWTKAQQQRTRAYFDGIPWRDALRAPGRAAAEGRQDNVQAAPVRRKHLLRAEGADAAAAAVPGDADRP
jgi:prolyl oligopeptidase PreP (S9A serine peptidase family)